MLNRVFSFFRDKHTLKQTVFHPSTSPVFHSHGSDTQQIGRVEGGVTIHMHLGDGACGRTKISSGGAKLRRNAWMIYKNLAANKQDAVRKMMLRSFGHDTIMNLDDAEVRRLMGYLRKCTEA